MFCARRNYRQWIAGTWGIILGVALVGCLPTVAVQLTTPASMSAPKASTQVAGQTIYLEVAQTPEEQASGLMYRTSLADDRGMLFPFNPAQKVGFWMKNVPIPLDIIFLRDGKVVNIAADSPSCNREPCPVYFSAGVIDQVLELRGGRAAELGIKLGDSLPINWLPPVHPAQPQ